MSYISDGLQTPLFPQLPPNLALEIARSAGEVHQQLTNPYVQHSFKIMTWNFHGISRAGAAASRKTLLSNVIGTCDGINPSIILFQEWRWTNTEKALSNNLPTLKHYTTLFGTRVGGAYIGFLFDPNSIELVVHINHDQVAQEVAESIFPGQLVRFGLRNQLQMRLMLCQFRLKSGNQNFILAVWHGPHNSVTSDGKLPVLQGLIQIIKRYSDMPVILGGDFNLDLSTVVDALPIPLQENLIVPGVDDTQNDFFCYVKNPSIELAEVAAHRPKTGTEEDRHLHTEAQQIAIDSVTVANALDHPLISGWVQFRIAH